MDTKKTPMTNPAITIIKTIEVVAMIIKDIGNHGIIGTNI
jgi:hypothetical protein